MDVLGPKRADAWLGHTECQHVACAPGPSTGGDWCQRREAAAASYVKKTLENSSLYFNYAYSICPPTLSQQPSNALVPSSDRMPRFPETLFSVWKKHILRDLQTKNWPNNRTSQEEEKLILGRLNINPNNRARAEFLGGVQYLCNSLPPIYTLPMINNQ